MLEKVNKKTLEKLSTQINRQKSVVLFWDTCSLLDIIRLPFRTSSDKYLDYYQQISELIIDGRIISVASELTIAEINYNFQNVEVEYDKYLKKLQNELELHEDYLIKCNIIAQKILDFKLHEKGLKQYLSTLFNKIIANTTFVAENKTFNKFAHFRVSYHIAPAQRKGEYKDCYIWSTCLELSKVLVPSNSKIYFFTRNKDDFYENGQLFQLIQDDCNNSSITIKYEVGDLLGVLLNNNLSGKPGFDVSLTGN